MAMRERKTEKKDKLNKAHKRGYTKETRKSILI